MNTEHKAQPWRIPQHLPVLTPANKLAYPKWHRYYESVYHHPVKQRVDLNTFTWFYWTAPLEKLPQPRCHMRPATQARLSPHKIDISSLSAFWIRDKRLQCSTLPTRVKSELQLNNGDAFRGFHPTMTQLTTTLMRVVSLYGFFVKRKHMLPSGSRSRRPGRCEVLHVIDDWKSTYSSWYWCVRGSGVFLQLNECIPNKAYKRIRHREDLQLFKKTTIHSIQEYDKIDHQLPTWMRQQQIQALCIEIAHGVPELIVIDPIWNQTREEDTNHSTKEVQPLVHYDSVTGVNRKYITAGDTNVIYNPTMCEPSRLLTFVSPPTFRAPVWSTANAYELHHQILTNHDTLAIERWLQLHTATERYQLLNRWTPIHSQIELPRNGEISYLDTVCTPLATAVLTKRLSIIPILIKNGAELSSKCPLHHLGENDPKVFTVISYLKKVVPQLQESKNYLNNVWDIIYTHANDNTKETLRKEFATTTRRHSLSDVIMHPSKNKKKTQKRQKKRRL